jgi:hypothetical protein
VELTPTAVVSQLTIDPETEGVYQKLTGKVLGKAECHHHRTITGGVRTTRSHQTTIDEWEQPESSNTQEIKNIVFRCLEYITPFL